MTLPKLTLIAFSQLHNNRLPVVPRQLSHLACLTSLHLAGNLLTEFPLPLLALDTLVELDLSSNRIEYLWQAEDVAESRAELTAWRKEQGPNELGGVWAGLDAPASPTKRDRRRTPIDLTRPMAGLKVLRLGNNRLANDALGLDSDAHLPLPLGLTELDLSDNFIRGPLPLHFFARLDSLQVLDIGGNGISSQVFELQSTGGSDVAAPESVFPSLKTLDVHRCDIDDLQPLEAVFGSPRTIAHGEKPHLAGADVSSPLAGVRARQLISAARRRPEETSNGSLYVVLEGNPLREEGFRRKRGGGAARSVSAGVMAAVEKGDPAPNKRADIDANGQTSGAAQSPAPPRRAPAQQAPVNEWAPLGSSSAPPPRKTPQARIAPPRAGPSISQRPAVTATASNDDAFGPLGGAKPNAAAPVNGAAHDAPKFAPSPTKAARATPPAAPEWEAPMSEGQKRRLRAEQARAAEAASSGSTPDAQEHPQPAADAEPATVSAPPQPPVKVAAAAAAAQSPRKRGAAAWESSGALW
jgi:Leucine-rich repeat (LRR) protein